MMRRLVVAILCAMVLAPPEAAGEWARKVQPYFPLNNTSKKIIEFSWDRQSEDYAYYFQLYRADGSQVWENYVYRSSVGLAVSVGAYQWRVAAGRRTPAGYENSPFTDWVFFSVVSSVEGMEDLLGVNPLKPSAAGSTALSYPEDAVLLPDGSYLIADSYHHVIKRVANGISEVYAGTGLGGYNGDGSRLTIQLNLPGGMAVDASGDLIFLDSFNYLIRRLNFATGAVTTVAGVAGQVGQADAAMHLVDNRLGWMVYIINKKNVLYIPMEFSDASGLRAAIYVLEGSQLRLFEPTMGFPFQGIHGFDILGNDIFVLNGGGGDRDGRVTRITNGVAVDLVSGLAFPRGLVALAHDHIVFGYHTTLGEYLGEFNAGVLTLHGYGTFGHIANISRLLTDEYLITDADGAKVLIGRLRSGNFTSSLVAGNSGSPFAGPVDLVQLDSTQLLVLVNQPPAIYAYDVETGHTVKVAGNGQIERTFSGLGATETPMFYPSGLAVDAGGNIYYGEQHKVFRIDKSTGIVELYVGSSDDPGFLDNVNRLSAQFYSIRCLGMDSAGNLIICDTYNNRVRKVDKTTGQVITIAGNGSTNPGYGPALQVGINHPWSVAAYYGGLYIAAAWQNSISFLGTDGTLQRAAGVDLNANYQGSGAYLNGYRLDAMFNTPTSLALIGGRADLIAADQFNNRIRRVNTYATTLIGDGRNGLSPTTLNLPSSALALKGRVFIADPGNGLVRSIPLE